MWEVDCKESWTLKNWCFWTVVLEKTLESSLDCKEIQPVHPKGDQSWVFFGRNDVEAETPILWPPHVKSWLIGKDSDAGRDWGQEEKGTTEDEMAGWHHRLDGCEFKWTPGVGDRQEGLACCDSWGHKESDTTERLNWTYCVGFFHISTWISHRYTYFPSLLNLPPTSSPIPPLYIVTEHWVWAPCIIQPIPTAIYFIYGNVYISIRPSLSFFRCVHKSVLSQVCISIAALQISSSVPSF